MNRSFIPAAEYPVREVPLQGMKAGLLFLLILLVLLCIPAAADVPAGCLTSGMVWNDTFAPSERNNETACNDELLPASAPGKNLYAIQGPFTVYPSIPGSSGRQSASAGNTEGRI
jgi:hypothetical protein